MTNERLNPDILNKYIFFQSPWQPFQVTWCIDKKSRKEKLHRNDYVTMYVYSKTPLGTCLSQMGKQLHAGAIGQLHDDVIWLQLPESLSLLFSYAN